jgi:hypothetical protein
MEMMLMFIYDHRINDYLCCFTNIFQSQNIIRDFKMKNVPLKKRALHYSKIFPNYPPIRVDDRWMDGVWFMGNNYKGSGYYGAYPPGYLKRIFALFPDAQRVLHLFSGSLNPDDLKKLLPYAWHIRVDVNKELKPDLVCEAEELPDRVMGRKVDLILADPPYSVEDALRYGVPMCNRNKVVKACARILEKGGYLVWLDQVLPMYRKDQFLHVGALGVVRSTNHRFRMISIFRRV